MELFWMATPLQMMMFILHLLLYRYELVKPESGLCCIIGYTDWPSDRPDSRHTKVSLFTDRRHDHSNLKPCEKRKMTKNGYLAAIAVITSLLLSTVSTAGEPREITWDDLVPAEAQFDDAFTVSKLEKLGER